MRACVFTLAILLAAGQAWAGESAKDLGDRASAAYYAKDYARSADLYAAALESSTDAAAVSSVDLMYNGACAAALAGRKDQALDLLERAVASGYGNIQHLQADTDLAALHPEPRWRTLLAAAEKAKAERDRMWNNPGFTTGYRTVLTEEERVAGLSRLWSEVKFNYANFDLVPDLDWDALYLQTLPRVRGAADTPTYYRELKAFVARLHDGHSGVWLEDAAARDRIEARPGLTTRYIEGRVIVRDVFDQALRDRGIARGWEIVAVDGEPVAAYAERQVRPYIAASTPQDLASGVYERQLLAGPLATPLRVAFRDAEGDSRTLAVARMPSAERAAAMPKTPAFEWAMLPGGIALVTLRSFGDDTAARRFEAEFDRIAQAKAIVFDLRDNGGGNNSVAYRILSTLTDKPFKTSAWRTRQYMPALRAWGLGEKTFNGAPGEYRPDGKRFFAKPVLLLTSARTYSAAEDFAVAFDAMGRGRIVGEATGGSTGQPLSFSLPGGIGARVCTKRDTYPDGKEFVGVGVIPQVKAGPTVADFRAGRDTVLEAALQLL